MDRFHIYDLDRLIHTPLDTVRLLYDHAKYYSDLDEYYRGMGIMASAQAFGAMTQSSGR